MAFDKVKYDIEYAKEKLKRVSLTMQLKDYEELKEHIERTKEPVNTFIKRAIKETIYNDTEKGI